MTHRRLTHHDKAWLVIEMVIFIVSCLAITYLLNNYGEVGFRNVIP